MLKHIVLPRRLRALGIVALIALCLVALIVSVEAVTRRTTVDSDVVRESVTTDGPRPAPDSGETFTIPPREMIEAP